MNRTTVRIRGEKSQKLLLSRIEENVNPDVDPPYIYIQFIWRNMSR